MHAAIEYLEDLGRGFKAGAAGSPQSASRSDMIRTAMGRIAEYERTLSAKLLDEMASIPGVTVHGVTDRDRLHQRVPTLCFTVAGHAAADIADGLAARDVGVRSGHMYSPRLMARMGLLPGGVVRASLVHYNTASEIDAFAASLKDVIGARQPAARA
jgi:selenocysteine lyase/cysteine desulfurase